MGYGVLALYQLERCMIRTFPAVLFTATLALSHSSPGQEADVSTSATNSPAARKDASKEEKFDSEKRLAALRVQLFLDREGFGPGKIDGRWGGFSRKAAERWNAAGRQPGISISPEGDLAPREAGKLPFQGDLITRYTVTESDQAMLGELPDSPEAMAKQESLPYADLLECVSEKFHADPDFIREINGMDESTTIAVGSTLKVPNVAEPFDLSEPMKLAKEASAEENEDKDSPETEEKNGELTVLRDERVVELRENGELTHSFPISPGANDNRSPAGQWKVSTISWMPEFRWDKSMLEDGKRSDNAFLLPPGPNNPVGIVWIGISADGIGLHGTPNPDAIGRNRSHGCIRLANWDALKMAQAVAPGTKVVIK